MGMYKARFEVAFLPKDTTGRPISDQDFLSQLNELILKSGYFKLPANVFQTPSPKVITDRWVDNELHVYLLAEFESLEEAKNKTFIFTSYIRNRIYKDFPWPDPERASFGRTGAEPWEDVTIVD